MDYLNKISGKLFLFIQLLCILLWFFLLKQTGENSIISAFLVIIPFIALWYRAKRFKEGKTAFFMLFTLFIIIIIGSYYSILSEVKYDLNNNAGIGWALSVFLIVYLIITLILGFANANKP